MGIFFKLTPSRFLFAIFSVALSRGQSQPAAPSNAPPLPTISAAPSTRVIPPPPNYAYPNGQTYVYGVEWHLFNAGTASVNLGLDAGQQHGAVVGLEDLAVTKRARSNTPRRELCASDGDSAIPELRQFDRTVRRADLPKNAVVLVVHRNPGDASRRCNREEIRSVVPGIASGEQTRGRKEKHQREQFLLHHYSTELVAAGLIQGSWRKRTQWLQNDPSGALPTNPSIPS